MQKTTHDWSKSVLNYGDFHFRALAEYTFSFPIILSLGCNLFRQHVFRFTCIAVAGMIPLNCINSFSRINMTNFTRKLLTLCLLAVSFLSSVCSWTINGTRSDADSSLPLSFPRRRRHFLSHKLTYTLFFRSYSMYRTPNEDAMGAANAPSWAVFWERFSMTWDNSKALTKERRDLNYTERQHFYANANVFLAKITNHFQT